MPEAKPDLCSYFGECGGCQSQDMPYTEQLANKEAMLQELLAQFWDGPIPVAPSPILWNYRNKVDPNFAPKHYDTPPPPGFERETLLGFKKRGTWYWPLDVEECRIGPEGLGDLLGAVRAWYREHDLRAFDARSKKGLLRTLLVRDGKRTGQRMVVLITSEGDFDKQSFIDAVNGAWPATSIYRGTTDSLASVAFAEDENMELIYGEPTIDEELHIENGDGLRELHFRISPFSFTQTNSLAAEKLYGFLRQWVQSIRPKILYDLYGGAGGIAFSCADLVQHVHSVENVESASEDGRHNAQVNEIDNVTFYTEKVKNFLKRHIERGGLHDPDNTIIVDPPRAGLHPKALRRLNELLPPHIIYVSCKPEMYAKELPAFLENYTIHEMKALDLFPHTRHVEVLTWLTRSA